MQALGLLRPEPTGVGRGTFGKWPRDDLINLSGVELSEERILNFLSVGWNKLLLSNRCGVQSPLLKESRVKSRTFLGRKSLVNS
jgi:hypothetical protein